MAASRPPTPTGPQALAELALSAIAGGAALGLTGVPAGWLSGAMLGVAALAGARRAPLLPAVLRRVAVTLAGVGMGAGLTPQTISTLSHYPVTLALMACALVAMTGASFLVLRRSPGFSPATAFYSAIPGALSYVFVVAEPAGADMARLAVIQIFRIFVLMAIIPIVAKLGLSPSLPVFAVDPAATTLLLLALAVPLGWALERRGVPSGPLYAGILVSAVAHVFGWAPGRLSLQFQVVAQTLVGAWVGTRFIGFDWELLHRTVIAAITSFLAAFIAAAAFAALAAQLSGVPFAQALAAFAPGGLEAMTLMAFALGLDPLFVGSHHLARFFMISLALPFVSRRLGANSP